MPIAEIVAEIDLFISRLRQARELLSGQKTESPQKRAHPGKGKGTNKRVGAYTSSERQAGGNESRSNLAVARLKTGVKRVDTGAHGPNTSTIGTVAKDASSSAQPAVAQPERATEKSTVVIRVPPRRRISSIRSVRHRTVKSELGTKPDENKPAIALAASMRNKVVVVSAEQMRREREQAAQLEIRRPQKLPSGISGRQAFEFLFPE